MVHLEDPQFTESRQPPYRFHESAIISNVVPKELRDTPIAKRRDIAKDDPWGASGFFGGSMHRSTRPSQMAYRLFRAAQLIRESVETDPERRGGVPVIMGTRFTVSQVLAQIAEGDSIHDIAEDFDLNAQHLQKCMQALSVALDRPIAK